MKVLARALLGLGVFLVVVGVLALVWAPGAVKKTPIDVDTVTMLDGTAARLDPSTSAFVKKPVYVKSLTRVDSKNSSDSTDLFVADTCVVFVFDDSRDCVDASNANLINASVDIFAADRVTALATTSSKLPRDAVTHHGLTNKWPFNAQKKTYPFWDGTVGHAVDAKYVRTATVEGLQTYVYSTTVSNAPIQIGEGIKGTYTDTREFYVEPSTGAVVNQVESQQRALQDGTPALDLDVAYTDAQVHANVSDAKDNTRQLTVLLVAVPVVGLGLGALCLLAGVVLLRRSRRLTGTHAGEVEPAPALR